jgi:hypothetical protein
VWALLMINHGCRRSRRITLLWHEALTSEMSQLSAVEARKATVGSLLWWADCSLRWRWGRSTAELLLLRLLWAIAPVLLLLRLAQVTPRWGIHHTVLGRSTSRTPTASRSRHHLLSLFLIDLRNDLHHSLLINGELYQALLYVDGESCTVYVGLLLISIDVV